MKASPSSARATGCQSSERTAGANQDRARRRISTYLRRPAPAAIRNRHFRSALTRPAAPPILNRGFPQRLLSRLDELMMTVADFLMLLVEDDPDQVRIIQETFAKANLVNPLHVVDRADRAIDYLSAGGAGRSLPSLVLIDLDLPGRDALKVLDWLNVGAPRKIPVVLLVSPDADPAALDEAREKGVLTSIPKPLDLEGMLRMMQSIGMYWMILDRCPASEPAAVAAGAPDPVVRRHDTDILGHRITFQKTSWELVRAARTPEALDGLIRMYWKPLYFFVRRRGYDNETAKDLVQDFLTSALENDTLSKADPTRGRFRTFLLTALTNFIKDWNRSSARIKRGGGRDLRSLDFEGSEQEYALVRASEETPEAVFHRAWAQGLLAECIASLKGKPSHLRAFELLMKGGGYPEICRETGLNE
ncbi:MAG: response regulator, partial [Planctomycetota bacterium]